MFIKTLVIPAVSIIYGWKTVSLSSEDILLDLLKPKKKYIYIYIYIYTYICVNELYVRSHT